jgi:hypothetical protein
VDADGAHVYERFFGGQHQPVPRPGARRGVGLQLPIPGASWHNRLGYTPSFEDFTGDYLLRFETELLIPVWEAISFRVAIVNRYDSMPAEDTGENSLSSSIGLSYGF